MLRFLSYGWREILGIFNERTFFFNLWALFAPFGSRRILPTAYQFCRTDLGRIFFNLTEVAWVYREDALCPSNVTSARESMIVDGTADCDMGQVNSIPNQYGVYLDLIFLNLQLSAVD
jgi:hypothetical protein